MGSVSGLCIEPVALAPTNSVTPPRFLKFVNFLALDMIDVYAHLNASASVIPRTNCNDACTIRVNPLELVIVAIYSVAFYQAEPGI